ncbi:DUF1499 domain-containing protein [Allosphingosinicella sp.]|jgi:multisubunit Na+/H+ antiporter MnhE subunit|uniref:DUF1499 domain-containing protein n=1 Tax=Allosphingosinicella sp. TaxID=2823234 RepID=UPI002F046541
MAEASKRSSWARRLTLAAALVCFGSVAAAFVGAVGSGQEWWHFRIGFKILEYAFYAAAAGAVLALAAIFLSRRGAPRLVLVNLAALVVALGYLFYLGSQVRTARSVVALHDITTNLDDNPGFSRLPIREDNLANLPVKERPDLQRLEPGEQWKALHREHYPDLRTVRVPWTVEETVRRAEALARDRGWEVVAAAPAEGLVEAVETSRFFRFKDNVVVRVRPLPSGTGSMVDMRSISRVGGSDVGVNARRIRSFLADLQAYGP